MSAWYFMGWNEFFKKLRHGIMRHLVIALSFFLFQLASLGQSKLADYEDIIDIRKDYEIVESNKYELLGADVSNFWCNNQLERKFGFIGSNYSRLRMKFLSVIKNIENPSLYFVYGRSMVSDNICSFQGTIEIVESYYIKSKQFPKGNTGILAGKYIFSEDPKATHSGVFKGEFVSVWQKDSEGQIKYRQLPAIQGNNQFAGTWTEYGKSKAMIANWGDGRVPQSGDLDVGTGEFGVDRKYQSNGWDSFIKATRGGFPKEVMDSARTVEMQKWWLDE